MALFLKSWYNYRNVCFYLLEPALDDIKSGNQVESRTGPCADATASSFIASSHVRQLKTIQTFEWEIIYWSLERLDFLQWGHRFDEMKQIGDPKEMIALPARFIFHNKEWILAGPQSHRVWSGMRDPTGVNIQCNKVSDASVQQGQFACNGTYHERQSKQHNGHTGSCTIQIIFLAWPH